MTAANSADLKRKVKDLNLKVITIDKMHDLTLIVGIPGHPIGQKAFRVNKGSLRNISPVWAKMLSGDWSESTKSEINFPDDSCDAFLIVLRIAHFQLSQLPEALSREALLDLAAFTDKYCLAGAVQIGLALKNWMVPHRKAWIAWPAHVHLQDFVVITSAFKFKQDFDYLVNRLVMEVQVDELQAYFYGNAAEKKVKLRSDLPTCVHEDIRRIRSEILRAWVACSTVGLRDAIKAPLPPCKKVLCASTKVGVLIQGLEAGGFFPSPSNTDGMHRSVLSYWQSIKSIGASHIESSHIYNGGYRSASNVGSCFGDFGIVTNVRAILQKNAHETVWTQWQATEVV